MSVFLAPAVLRADFPPLAGDLYWRGIEPAGATGIVNPHSGPWSNVPGAPNNWLEVLVDSGTTGTPVAWANSTDTIAHFPGNIIAADAAVEVAVVVADPILTRRLVFDNTTFTGINHNGDLVEVATNPQRYRFTPLAGASLQFGRGRAEAIYDSYTFLTGPDVFAVHLDNRFGGGTTAQNTPVIEAPITGALAPSAQDVDDALFGGTAGNVFGGLGIRGNIELAGANTFAGGVNVINGTLTVRDDANLGEATGDVRLFRGATLRARFIEDGAIQRLTLNAERDLVAFPLPGAGGGPGSGGGAGGTSLRVDVDTHTLRVDGRVLGPGLDKTGTGELELASGTNNFENLWVREGAVEILPGANGGRRVTLGDYAASSTEPRLTYRGGTHTIESLQSIQNQGELELDNATLRIESSSSLFGGSTFGGTLSGDGTLVISGANTHVTLGRNIDIVGGPGDFVGDSEAPLLLAGVPPHLWYRDPPRSAAGGPAPATVIESGTLAVTDRGTIGSELLFRGGSIEALRKLTLFVADATFPTSYGSISVPMGYDERVRSTLIVEGDGTLRGSQPIEFVSVVLRADSSLTLDFHGGGFFASRHDDLLDDDYFPGFRENGLLDRTPVAVQDGRAAIVGSGSVDHTDLRVQVSNAATLVLEERSSQLALHTLVLDDGAGFDAGSRPGLEVAAGSDVSVASIFLVIDVGNYNPPGPSAPSLTKLGAGTLRVNGITRNQYTDNASANWIVEAGTLGGVGPFGDVTLRNGAVFAPGNSPGTATIAGDFTLEPGALLLLEIASATLFDQLVVGGTLTLDGLVTIRFLDGYVPDASLTFPLLQATTTVGAFSGITFEGLPEGVTLPASNFVTVVPEPSTYAALLGVAVFALAAARRGVKRAPNARAGGPGPSAGLR